MEEIAQALLAVPEEAETQYLRRVRDRCQRVLDQNRELAQDIEKAHQWLLRLAECLGYRSEGSGLERSSQQVRNQVEALEREFQTDWKRYPAQALLSSSWRRLWKRWGEDLLPCYDIAGLPADNLKLEALFLKLRNDQRRISGRKCTRPLRDFGALRMLLEASSLEELLGQLQQVPVQEYLANRKRLAEAEEPRQRQARLHRDPLRAVTAWVKAHAARREQLRDSDPPTYPLVR
jgi:hypothetical protein